MPKVYKSEVGIEIIGLFILLSLFNIYTLLYIETENNLLFFAITICLYCPIFISWLGIRNTSYTIYNNTLYIKSNFFFKEELSIKDIQKIEEVTNLIKAPTGSIKCLEIFYGKYDSILISPQKKDQFIRDLLSINKNIDVRLKK